MQIGTFKVKNVDISKSDRRVYGRRSVAKTTIPDLSSYRWLAITVLVLLVLSQTGCSAARILGVDFDNYSANTADENFSGAVPGLPEGDAVEEHGFINGSLTIEPNGPVDGTNNLRVLDESPPGVFRPALISFVVSDHSSAGEYRIAWEGLTEDTVHHTEVLFLDASGNQALKLTFIDQSSGTEQVILVSSGTGSVTPIPVDPGRAHDVLVVIRPDENLVDIRYESDGTVRRRSDLAFTDPEFGDLRFVRFAGLNPASAYYVAHLDALARS